MGEGPRAAARDPVKVMVPVTPETHGKQGDLIIRAARRDDISTVVAIENATFGDPWSAGGFTSCLAREEILFDVIELCEAGTHRLAGYAVMWLAADQGELANLAVSPELRGRGLGARLLDHVVETARRKGVVDLFLEVRESNVAARALYCARQFEEVGRRQRYYRAPVEDALVMRRAL